MPSIIIKIFAVMEIISHYEALAEVISLVWIATLGNMPALERSQ